MSKQSAAAHGLHIFALARLAIGKTCVTWNLHVHWVAAAAAQTPLLLVLSISAHHLIGRTVTY